MKRRNFIQTLAVTPAVAFPVSAEAQSQQPAAPQARPTEEIKLDTTSLDAAAETVQRYFNPQQFATLRKLSEIIMPSLKGMPGALEAGAPEFLDFLISKSPAERQQIYKTGLDTLNAQALKQFKKPFAEIDATQAHMLLAPLREAWTYVPPTDPFARFLRDAKADIRNATMNSREYATASSAGGRRGGSGMGQYWYPID